MTLRRRLALLSALAVAFAVLLASGLVYTLVRDRLRGDIDNDLHHQADVVTQRFETAGPLVAGQLARGNGAAVGQAGTSASVGVGPPPGFPPPSTTKVKQGKPPKAPTPKQIREGGGRILQFAVPSPGPGGPPSLAQLIGPGGAVVTDPDSQYRIPVSPRIASSPRTGATPPSPTSAHRARTSGSSPSRSPTAERSRWPAPWRTRTTRSTR